MKKELDELTQIVGVLGALVVDSQGEIIASQMPPKYSSDCQKKASYIIKTTFSGCEYLNYQVESMYWEFDNHLIISKKIKDGILIVITEKNIALPLLNLSLNLCAKKIEEHLKSSKPKIPTDLILKDIFRNLFLEIGEKGIGLKNLANSVRLRLRDLSLLYSDLKFLEIKDNQLDFSKVSPSLYGSQKFIDELSLIAKEIYRIACDELGVKIANEKYQKIITSLKETYRGISFPYEEFLGVGFLSVEESPTMEILEKALLEKKPKF